MKKKLSFDFGIEINDFHVKARRTGLLELGWQMALQEILKGNKPKFLIDGIPYEDYPKLTEQELADFNAQFKKEEQ